MSDLRERFEKLHREAVVPLNVIDLMVAAAEIEREECAQLADDEAEGWRGEDGRTIAISITEAIRARGAPTDDPACDACRRPWSEHKGGQAACPEGSYTGTYHRSRVTL